MFYIYNVVFADPANFVLLGLYVNLNHPGLFNIITWIILRAFDSYKFIHNIQAVKYAIK